MYKGGNIGATQTAQNKCYLVNMRKINFGFKATFKATKSSFKEATTTGLFKK